MKTFRPALVAALLAFAASAVAQTPTLSPKVDDKTFQEKSGSMLAPPPGTLTIAPTGSAIATATKADASAAIARTDAPFLKRHDEILARGKTGPVGVLFLGDSITAGWASRAHIWDRYFGKLEPANFGIGSDRTQNVIWRIENGELDGLHPKVVVLMIGTNNSDEHTGEEIAAANKKIIAMIQAKSPGTKVLLTAIFPRGARKDAQGVITEKQTADATKRMAAITAANTELAKLDNGTTVRFLDVNANFLGQDGKIPWPIMPDQLHPTAAGYQLWAEAMQKPLAEMMK